MVMILAPFPAPAGESAALGLLGSSEHFLFHPHHHYRHRIFIIIFFIIIIVIIIIPMQIIVIKEGRSVIIQSLAKLKILSKEELKTSKYCKSFGIQLNLSKKMPKRGRNTQKLISVFFILFFFTWLTRSLWV